MSRHPGPSGPVRPRWTTLFGALIATAVILGSSAAVMTAAKPGPGGSAAARGAVPPPVQALGEQVSAATRLVEPAAPSKKAYALGLVNNFLKQYDKAGFAKATALGSAAKYKAALNAVTLKIDSRLKKVAVFDPVANTVTLSFDPAKVKKSERLSRGETIWHELTHKIEATQGDSSVLVNKLWDERNTEYMTHVADVALPILTILEKKAGAKATDQELLDYWNRFNDALTAGAALPETAKYPTDPDLQAKWFGFTVDPRAISRVYASGKSGLGAAATIRLREAFRARLDPRMLNASWTGTRIPEALDYRPQGFNFVLAFEADGKGTLTFDWWAVGSYGMPAATYIDGVLTMHYYRESVCGEQTGEEAAWICTTDEWTVTGTAVEADNGRIVMNGQFTHELWSNPAVFGPGHGTEIDSGTWSASRN